MLRREFFLAVGATAALFGMPKLAARAKDRAYGLTPQQIDEFVQLTLDRYRRQSWTEIALQLERYEKTRK